MPLYEYACPVCEKTESAIIKVADRDNEELVPSCDQHEELVPMKRCISRGTGFQLKGRGWYKDGYS